MAILGESFKNYVIDQINTRQEKLSASNKNNDLLKFLSSKTSFIRLTSGVDITPALLSYYKLPFEYGNQENLAKQFVLEAARFKGKNDPINDFPYRPTAGVGYSDVTTSYGFSSDSNYGLVPPPGIVMASVKSLNRGTVREATIQIQCHNIYQFNIINILFLKLKYSLLLEWGHTVYYNNEGTLTSGYNIPNLSNDFLTKKYNSSAELLKVIEEKRQVSCGNYDAFFGLIKNFEWQIEENGSYTITIVALSQGDIIDSLKINTDFDPTRAGSDSAQFNKSTLHKIIGTIRSKLRSEKFINGYNTGDGKFSLNTESLSAIIPVNSTGSKYNYRDSNDNNKQILTATESNNILTEKEGFAVVFPKLEVSQNANGQNVQTAQYYIKLGTFLRIIEAFCLFYDTTKNITATGSNENLGHPPIFHIDHNFEAHDCLTLPNQLSINPLIALIPLFTSGSTDQPPISITGIFEQKRQNIIYGTGVPDASKTTKPGAWQETRQIVGGNDELNTLGVSQNTAYVNISSVPSSWAGGQPFDADLTGLRSQPNTTIASSRYQGIAKAKSTPYDATKNIVEYIQFEETRYVQTTAKIEKGNTGTLKGIDNKFRTTDKYIGKTMHIYVNTQHIVNVLDSNIDKNGSVPLQTFLTSLLNDISVALGSINSFDLDYNDSTNTFSIVDSAVIPLKYPELAKKAIFNINSLNPLANKGGSFVNNFSLKSEIFSSIGNAIALGSRGDGAATSGIGKMYVGVKDRWFENPSNNLITLKLQTFSEKEEFIRQQYSTFEGKLKNNQKTGPSLTQEDIDYYTSYVVGLLQHDLGVATAQGNNSDPNKPLDEEGIPGTGFIPVNLQLTIDGLSGLLQYQTFEITPNILPPEYYEKISFITTTIEHKIDTKGWETTINTLGMPKKKK
jgi:hypothetical protein